MALVSLLYNVLDEELSGLVGAANQWTRGRVEEAELGAALLPESELLGRDVLDHFEMSLCRLHVLAQGQAINADRSQVLHGLLNFGVLFAWKKIRLIDCTGSYVDHLSPS